jgi:hypothetical protein
MAYKIIYINQQNPAESYTREVSEKDLRDQMYHAGVRLKNDWEWKVEVQYEPEAWEVAAASVNKEVAEGIRDFFSTLALAAGDIYHLAEHYPNEGYSLETSLEDQAKNYLPIDEDEGWWDDDEEGEEEGLTEEQAEEMKARGLLELDMVDLSEDDAWYYLSNEQKERVLSKEATALSILEEQAELLKAYLKRQRS